MLFHCYNENYLIEVINSDGEIIRKIDRPYEPVPCTESEKNSFRESFRNMLGNQVRNIDFPNVKTVTDNMLVDEEGNLWVKLNEYREVEGSPINAYDIFDKDGYYYAQVWCNVEPEMFIGGKMYRMHRDTETGIRTVKRYRVLWRDET